MTLILPYAQGIASERAAVAGMLINRRHGQVDFAPVDARLAPAQLAAIHATKVSR